MGKQPFKVAIIDYQAGNLTSCHKAFEHVAAKLGHENCVEIVDTAAALDTASHIVLPGQGAFGDCANQLNKISGMREALETYVRKQGRPFFGICVGMQLLADRGLEFGEHEGFGWIGGEVTAMKPDDASLKIPHMGWNDLRLKPACVDHPVMQGVSEGDHAYFVHSFYFAQKDQGELFADVDYGGPVTAIVGRDNIIGTQFHPEKSQGLGLRMIENFLRWNI